MAKANSYTRPEKLLAFLLQDVIPQRTEGKFGMLKHMVEAEVLDSIIGSMDVIIRIFEIGLNDEGGWVTSLGSRGMIGASIPALRFDRYSC